MGVFPKQFIKAPNSGNSHGSDGDWKAPRLSRALFEAPAGVDDVFRTQLEKGIYTAKSRAPVTLQESERSKFDAELKALFDHLRERLDGSLDEAWMSDAGYGSPEFKTLLVKARQAGKRPSEVVDASNADLADAAKFYDSGEERWARALCEKVVFSMYHTPGHVYGTPGVDKPWFNLFPGFYSASMTCQTLSTYCMLSRGWSLAQLGHGLGCTSGSARAGAFEKSLTKPMRSPSTKTAADVPPGTPEDKKQTALDKEQQKDLKIKGDAGENLGVPTWSDAPSLVRAGATPGSVVVYNGGGSGYNDQNVTAGITHIASVLRVSGSRLQFIDTGVVIGSEGELAAEGGTVDHGFQTGTLIHAASLIAFGAAKASDDAQLATWAAKIEAAKPLGVARLIIVATEQNRVLFISKLLPMRWPVSKLAWSLRALPARGLTAAWVVWLPHTTGWSESLAQGRTPSTAFTGSGSLNAANVIQSADKSTDKSGQDLHVFRVRTFSEWRQDFQVKGESKLPALLKLQVGDEKSAPTLGAWCEKQDNFDQCYVRPTGSAGSSSHAAIGHSLVDPA